MVALDTRGGPDPSRALTPETVRLLGDAIVAYLSGSRDAEALLRPALEATAEDAHERGLSPEAVLIALRTIEDRTIASQLKGKRPTAEEKRQCREWLVTECLKAYFAR